MTATIGTTHLASSWSGTSRMVDRTSTGVLWAVVTDASGTDAFSLYRSLDNGATWTLSAAFSPGTGNVGSAHMFIDANDVMHLVYVDVGGPLTYQQLTPTDATRTAYTFGVAAQLSVAGFSEPVCVAVPVDGATYIHVFATFNGGGGGDALGYGLYAVPSNGVLNTIAAFNSVFTFTNTAPSYAAVDFAHTGDGKTPSASPDVYVSFLGQGGAVQYGRYAYTGVGTWQPPSMRTLAASATALAGYFDGLNYVAAYVTAATPRSIGVVQRDRNDTITTTLTAPADIIGGSVAVAGLAATWDIATRDIVLLAASTGTTPTQQPEWARFSRGPQTWSSWTVVEAATAVAGTLMLRSSDVGRGADATYVTGSGSPYNARFTRIAVNNPPSAATWVNLDAQGADVAATLTLA